MTDNAQDLKNALGQNVPLSDLLAEVEANKAARAKAMPTEKDALTVMFSAYQRLKELGFNEACYCPKDGTLFDAIEAGSAGIHTCHYDGEWPKGHWWIHDAGDLWPSNPILWRKKVTANAEYTPK